MPTIPRRYAKPLGLSALTAILATLALATPSHAGTIKATCSFGGNAKITDKDDAGYGIRLVGGSGSFFVESFVVSCSGVNKGAPFIDVIDVAASGIYDNIICGTAKAVGSIVDVTKLPFPHVGYKSNLEPAIEGKKFALEFFAWWHGSFYWKADEFAKPSVIEKGMTSSKAPDKAEWDYAGEVHLTPPAPTSKPFPQVPSDPPDNCAKAIEVSGHILIDA